MAKVTCTAPVNIAVIKYWGKRDEELILPLNDSISSTLSMDFMCSKTTVMASPNFKENKIWLNGKEETFNNPRLINCLKELKNKARSTSDLTKYYVHICSENNFPTAAGLASSAAGYACLIYALAKLYKVEGDLSAFARIGSGSACRSVYGGWVQWHTGCLKDGSDSIATQVVPSSHWPEMRLLILVVNDARKKYSSTTGMRQSVLTSPFLKYRTESLVPERVEKMIQAIKQKDFNNFATLTMKDSNQFHSVCLDTFPPCTYMNDTSHSIVDLVHAYNDLKGSIKVAYTFDAGPNACLYLLESDVPEVLTLIKSVYPSPSSNTDYIKGLAVNCTAEVPQQIHNLAIIKKHNPGALKYIIHTKVGDGPKILEEKSSHLLNDMGFPNPN